jgi:hypothetical protein
MNTRGGRVVALEGTARIMMMGGAEGNQMTMEGVVRDEDVASSVTPLIEEMHRHAVDKSLREVVLDLRRLEYANAAFWKCIVVWLKRIRQDQTARYNLRLVASPEHSWQRIGVPALRVFGADRLVVEGLAPVTPPRRAKSGT